MYDQKSSFTKTATGGMVALMAAGITTGTAVIAGTPSATKEINVESAHAIDDLLEFKNSARAVHNVTALAWRPDGQAIATDGPGTKAEVFDAHTLKNLAMLDEGRGGSGSAVIYSRDGRFIASGHSTINLWDAKTHTKFRTIIGPYVDLSSPQPLGVKSLAFSPDGETMAVSYSSVQLEKPKKPGQMVKTIWPVVLYRVATGEVIWTHVAQPALKDHQEGVVLLSTPLEFTSDGRYLVGGVYEGMENQAGFRIRRTAILVVNAKNGESHKTIENIHADSPTAMALSADGRLVATGTSTSNVDTYTNTKAHEVVRIENNDPIRIWNLESGVIARELSVNSPVIALAFSPDSKYLVSSQENRENGKTLWVWDLKTGDLIQQIVTSRRAGPPSALAFSPDGHELAAVAGNEIQVYKMNR
jgi:WD40 repeat protein